MIIVICASMSAAKKVMSVKSALESMGHEVIVPRNTEKYADETLQMETAHEATANKIQKDLIRGYFDKIKNSDAVLVVNESKSGIENYIGGNTLIEIAFAHILNKDKYILNGIPELSYADEIRAMQPVVLYGDLTKIV